MSSGNRPVTRLGIGRAGGRTFGLGAAPELGAQGTAVGQGALRVFGQARTLHGPAPVPTRPANGLAP